MQTVSYPGVAHEPSDERWRVCRGRAPEHRDHFWNARVNGWGSRHIGDYTTYASEAAGKKAAAKLVQFWPDVGIEADTHPAVNARLP